MRNNTLGSGKQEVEHPMLPCHNTARETNYLPVVDKQKFML